MKKIPISVLVLIYTKNKDILILKKKKCPIWDITNLICDYEKL